MEAPTQLELPLRRQPHDRDALQEEQQLLFVDELAVQRVRVDSFNDDDDGLLLGLEKLRGMDYMEIRECGENNFIKKIASAAGYHGSKTFVISDEAGRPVLLAKEVAPWYMRMFAPANCRSYNFDVYVKTSIDDTFLPMLHLERPCAVPPCSPAMTVVHPASQRSIGSVKKSFRCCRLHFKMLDQGGRHVMSISSRRLDPARIVGKLPFGEMKSVDFDVTEPNRSNSVGYLSNVWKGFCSELRSDSDVYHADVGDVDSAENKALFVAASLYIDMRHFNSGRNLRDCALKRFTPLGQIQRAAPVLEGVHALLKERRESTDS